MKDMQTPSLSKAGPVKGPVFWLIAATFLVLIYWPALRGDFVYDDRWMVVDNQAVHSIQPRAYFFDVRTVAAPESGLDGDIYRPLTTLSYAVDHKLWGLSPLAWHMENLILHLAVGALFYLLLLRLSGRWSAVIGTAIFLVHPLQVQSVAWIAQRSGLLGALFLLAGIHCLLEASSRKAVLAGSVFYLLALLSKESSLVLPALVWILWKCPTVRAPRNAKSLFALLLGIGASYWFWRWTRVHQWSQMGDQGLGESLLLGLRAFPVYLGKMVAPIALRVSYRYPDPHQGLLVAGGAFAMAFVGVTMILWRKQRPLAVALAWIGIALIPFLQLIPIRAFVAERFAYVPLMGFALGVGLLAQRWPALRIPVGIWILVLGFGTRQASLAWRSEHSLWAHAVHVEPRNAFAHACLGQAARSPEEAETQYRLVLENSPSREICFAALNNLAWLSLRRGDAIEAMVWSKQALSIRPSDPQALYNRARAAQILGKADEARQRTAELEYLLGPNDRMVQDLKTYKRSLR